ncbi:MAG TPA: HupE/UreJ family protein [Vicinamibacterales bacterium]|nr:HupE/UreJ family protein [Vicinamibacterales bacterium]
MRLEAWRPAVIGVLLAIACARNAAAHSAPFSYIDLVLHDDSIGGSVTVHIYDAAHDLGIEPQEQLLDPAFLETQRAALEALLSSRLDIKADGGLLVPDWTGAEAVPAQQGVRLRFRLQAARPGSLTLHPIVFPYDPLHQTFVNVYEDDTLRQQFAFSVKTGQRMYYAGTRQGAVAVVRTFVPSGIQHILIGPDHVLFLIGLLLLGGGWRALVRIVTAFTIGHSLTLSLAALGVVSTPARVIEPAIALSIVLVGADNLMRDQGRDLRAWMALAFGLVHGFGFANVLREFGLPREALGWSLFSFNAGVEIGQLAIVLVVATCLAAIRRRSDAIGLRVAYAGSIVVAAAGSYWFVERVFFGV